LASNWQKIADLDASQWLVIFQSPFVLLLTWIRLRRGGFQKTLGQIDTGPDSGISAQRQALLARKTAFALAVVVKAGPWRPQCLVRSLALSWLLSRRGIPCVVRIGVPVGGDSLHAEGSDGFRAHAWVEHAGIVLNDRQDVATQFSAFDSGSDSV
jgi:hypothetical protein